tara:strand:+ start:132 stop:503 length:372 start_codon:yes stop_codon:yes gene_type:complete
MKKKAIFKTVAQHLLQQRERALSPDENSCAYRQPESDLTCAIGCLITDAHYHTGLEDKTVIDSAVCEAVSKSIGSPLTIKDSGLLSALQDIHDYDDITLWREKLNEVAELYFDKTLDELGVTT